MIQNRLFCINADCKIAKVYQCDSKALKIRFSRNTIHLYHANVNAQYRQRGYKIRRKRRIFMENKDFVTYEYMSKMAKTSEQAQVCDMYEAFGWEATSTQSNGIGETIISFKRDRKIRHKAELSKLERQASETYDEIRKLESAKTKSANAFSFTFGTFAALVFGGGMSLCMLKTSDTPSLVGGIVLGIVGAVLCGVNYLAYKSIAQKKTKQTLPLIDEKQEKLANLLEKGNELLATELI